MEDNSIKIVVLGIGTVGKSSLTMRYITNQFIEEYVPTLQDTFRKNISLDGQTAQLEIMDTAGQEDYIVMQELWIKQGKGFILVFSLVHEDSLKELQEIYNKIQSIHQQKVPIVLVGNKMDLERKISQQEGETYAQLFGAEYVETSAKTGKNCSQVFENLVRQIRAKDKPQQQPQKIQKKQGFFEKYCTLI